jgi:hypothetical protein
MGVFIEDRKRDRLWQDVADLSFRKLKRDIFTELYLIPGLFLLAVHKGEAALDQGLDAVAGDVRLVMRYIDIEALVVCLALAGGSGTGSGPCRAYIARSFRTASRASRASGRARRGRWPSLVFSCRALGLLVWPA